MCVGEAGKRGRNQEFIFEYIKFEMLVGHPGNYLSGVWSGPD